MWASLVILISLIPVVRQLEVKASYTTTFKCIDGSYAFIGGANLTLQYDYRLSMSELLSFHLYERQGGRHMFDYERLAGKSYIKDKRLKSFDWTDTGIKLRIPVINKDEDLGKYNGEAATDTAGDDATIEVNEIFDPPAEVKVTTTGGKEKVNLEKNFGEYVFNASAEPYSAINCSSVRIRWSSSAKDNLESCEAKEMGMATVCPFTLKESNMKTGDCMTLEVYGEQYGVLSEKKTYNVCYDASSSTPIILGVVFGVIAPVIIIIIVVAIYVMKRRGRSEGCKKNVKYSGASQAEVSIGEQV